MGVENELKDFASELSEPIAQHSTVPTVPVPECKEKKNWFSPALRIRIRIRTGSELIPEKVKCKIFNFLNFSPES